MATLQDSFNTGDDGIAAGPFDTIWHAQTFTPSSAYDITSVKVKMDKQGTGGTITARIQEVGGSGPDGVSLCSGTNSDNSAGNVWREVTFSPSIVLSEGTEYAIVISCNGADGSNTLKWRWDTDAPAYTGGEIWDSINSGSSWTVDGNVRDMMFECWGNDAVFAAPADKVTIRKLVAFANNKAYYET